MGQMKKQLPAKWHSQFNLFTFSTIKSKLVLSFSVFTALIFLSIVISLYSFESIESAFDKTQNVSIPSLNQSNKLTQDLYEVLVKLPEMVNATSHQERQTAFQEITKYINQLKNVTAELKDQELVKYSSKLESIVNRLNQNTVIKIDTRNQLNEMIRFVQKTYDNIQKEILVSIENQTLGYIMYLNGIYDTIATKDKQELLNQFTNVQILQEVLSDLNIFTSEYNKVFILQDAEFIDSIQKRVNTIKPKLDRNVPILRGMSLVEDVDSIVKIIEIGTSKNSIFFLKGQEFLALSNAQKNIEEYEDTKGKLSAKLIELKKQATLVIQEDAKSIYNGISQSTLFLLLFLTMSLILSVLIIRYYVSKNLIARLSSLLKTVKELTNKNYNVEVNISGKDELTELSKAIEIFRENGLEVEELRKERRLSEAQAKEEKRELINSLADNFETSVKSIVNEVNYASNQVHESAQQMSSLSENSRQNADKVESLSDQSSQNMNTIATAAEELSVSITEVDQSAQRSYEIVGQAKSQVDLTNEKVSELSESSLKIGEIVDLINSIAEQTNLLALNATIEAARAGDAGKGFAVVASEVKSLANQTSNATEEISKQIMQIQSVSENTADLVKDITNTIHEVTKYASEISNVTNEQGTSTKEISENITQAANSSDQVNQSAKEVNSNVELVSNASEEILDLSQKLTKQSSYLSEEADKFISEIRQIGK